MLVKSLCACTMLVGLCVGSANAANLVQNGGFETGNLNGWINIGWRAGSSIDGVTPYSGSYFASDGCVDYICSLSQTLSTVAGKTYNLSFAFNPGEDVSSGGADMKVFFGNDLVADFGPGGLGWTGYGFTVTATSSSTTLLFSGYQNPAYDGLDDVSVSGVSGVPLPASAPLFGAALVGLGAIGFGLKRKQAAAV